MINLEKIKYEKCQRTLLRRPAPAPYFHLLFLIFQIPPSLRQAIKIYSPPLKKGWGPNYVRSPATEILLLVISGHFRRDLTRTHTRKSV